MNNVSSSNSQKALVPELRFPEFRDDLQQSKLSDISVYKTKRATDVKSHYISTENLLQNCMGIVPYTDETAIDGISFSINDILLGNIRPYLKKAWLAEFGGVCSTDVLVLHPLKIESSYFKYLICRDKFFTYVMSSAKGSKMPRGDKAFIMDMTISLPSINEQKKLASMLMLIDTLISKQEKLVDELKLYKRGVISTLNCTALECHEIAVGNVFSITRGNVLATGNISPIKTEKFCYPVYSSQTKNDGLLGYYSDYLYEDAITWTTDGANAGYTKFRKGKFYCTNVCGVLINNDGYANNYVAELINSISKKYVSYVGNPKLMNNVMAEVKINLPNIENQEFFSRTISLIDSKISKECSILNSLLMTKNALLQKMFI